MQMTSQQIPHCIHVLHSQTEGEIRSALTKRWIQIINRLEEEKKSPALLQQCERLQGQER